MVVYLFLLLLAIASSGFLLGRFKARAAGVGQDVKMHSLDGYHGWFVAAWAGIPAVLLTLLWLLFQGPVIDWLLVGSLPANKVQAIDGGKLQLLVSQIKSVAAGNIFSQPEPFVVEAAERYNRWKDIASWSLFAVATVLALVGLLVARSRISPRFRARNGVETIMSGLMIACSVIAILTTLGIVVSLLYETLRFFDRVSVVEFFTGLNWEPQIPIREGQVTAGGAFGALPVFWGTMMIALIAMLVATPIGLFAAVYLTEYASARLRDVVKPLLEILAGIPTVVYGFFAVLTVAPAMRTFGEAIGLNIAPNSALAAGAVMGIMLIPFISSLSDDAINAVPQSLRDGSYGLGATKGETITKVLLPAALPGIMGGILLAVSRAIGETMIVVMAAGIIAALTLNPFEPVTTVTVQIVTLLIGDSEFDNPKTLAAFALGLVLFLATLVLNVIALRIVQKYREQYD
ncbi:MAG: phosphate ABC transporter permease subunit PstC [Hyphomicrobiaceae bacterium]|nr:phosphate ABC transporter permease subunit PstC [Hyphomicrobiaceae bacterium]MCC0010302.1 phosphate ABC transporter permease subunit PstC [Hyphomicrobiaceae bacterium]